MDEDVPALGTNPLGVEALDGVLGVVEAVVLVALVLVVLGALASLVARIRRGDPAERRALRPFMPVAVLWVAASTVDGPLDEIPGYGVASALILLTAFPLAVWAGLVRRPPEPTAGQVLEVSANPVR